MVLIAVVLQLFSVAYAQNGKNTYPGRDKDLMMNNVTWQTLGNYSADSMPLGNGDIGLNVWTEQNGDVLFYISKTDALDESANPVKVGRVRVSLSPVIFVNNAHFSQVLHLEDGTIQISGGDKANKVTLRIWVDANHQAVRIETNSVKPVSVKVTLDPWRTTEQNKPSGIVSADVVLPSQNNAIAWYHRNEKARAKNVNNLTFGAMMQGDGFVHGDGNVLNSASAKVQQRFSVYPYTATTASVNDWLSGLQKLSHINNSLNWENTFAAHQQWWNNFWQRSYIYIKGDSAAIKATQGYVLQRFVTACAGRGAHAIKFNGTIFTSDNPAESKGKDKTTGKEIIEAETADFRAWGGQYWFQNTRPIYWPLLATGDFDMMRPLFKQVFDMIPGNTAIIKQYYNHDGFYFAETANYWGGMPWMKPGQPGKYTDRYYTPVLELSTMMLDYYDYTGNKKFVTDTLLPIINGGFTFFEQHFPRDDKGKLLLYPDNSIEMYWDVSNPLPDIAGLHYVIERLLELPPDLVTDADRKNWMRLKAILPDIPMGVKDGKTVILPYTDPKGSIAHNTENPELYAIYPFRIYGLGKPGLDVALETFNNRLIKRTGCWHQDVIDAPMLGLTDLAKKDVVFDLTNSDKQLRFPAFWVRGHDYMPDEDNGGNGQLGLQKMLMQCDGKKILLLPAWPKEWTADFKVNAPYQTTIEGHVENGKISGLRVNPKSREGDVVVYDK
jgi:hypothetical protein